MSRILVVDREIGTRYAIERCLRNLGHEVTIAGCESEAVFKINHADPSFDLVITETFLESNESALKILRATLIRDAFTEVIVLTAYGVRNAIECVKMGAHAYVEKSINSVNFLDLLCIKSQQAFEHRASALSEAIAHHANSVSSTHPV